MPKLCHSCKHHIASFDVALQLAFHLGAVPPLNLLFSLQAVWGQFRPTAFPQELWDHHVNLKMFKADVVLCALVFCQCVYLCTSSLQEPTEAIKWCLIPWNWRDRQLQAAM